MTEANTRAGVAPAMSRTHLRAMKLSDHLGLSSAVRQMLSLQSQTNLKVHPHWDQQGYPFFRAAWTEAAEAMGYMTWEWWKNLASCETLCFKTEHHRREYLVELVDAFHFLISVHLLQYVHKPFSLERGAYDLQRILAAAVANAEEELDNLPEDQVNALLQSTEELTVYCLNGELNSAVRSLVRCLYLANADLGYLILLYVGKSQLNVLRQENGYKAGTYLKAWGANGEEDNVFLSAFVADMHANIVATGKRENIGHLEMICERVYEAGDSLYEKLTTQYQVSLDNDCHRKDG